MGKKKLLKPGPPVSRDHFSSGQAATAAAAHRDTTRCVVRVLEAADLLASDAETGKSDPLCFMWIGHRAATPVFDLADPVSGRLVGPGEGVLTTAVVPKTINPVWNSDHIFLLGPDVDAASLMLYKLAILVRDEDIEALPAAVTSGPVSLQEENKTAGHINASEIAPASFDDNSGAIVSYDPLGAVEITFKDIFRQGKKVNGSAIILGPIWKPLKKFDGMRRVEGRIKLSVSIIFSESDLDLMRQSLDLSVEARAAEVIEALQRRVDPTRPLSAGTSSTALIPSRSASPSEGRSRRSASPAQGRGPSSAPVSPIRPRSGGIPRGRGAPAASSFEQKSITDNVSEVGSQSGAGGSSEYYDEDKPLEWHPMQSDLSAIAEDETSQFEQSVPAGGLVDAGTASQPNEKTTNAFPKTKAADEVTNEDGLEPIFPLLEGGDESTPPAPNLDAAGASTAVSPLESPAMERRASKEAKNMKPTNVETQGKPASGTSSNRGDGSKMQRRGERSDPEKRRSESSEDEMLSQLREQLVLATNAAQKTEPALRESEELKSQLQHPVIVQGASKANPLKATKKFKDDEKRALAKQRLKDSLRHNPPISSLANKGPGTEEFDEDAGLVVRSKGKSLALVVGEEPPKKIAMSRAPPQQEVQESAAFDGIEAEEELVVFRPPESGGDENLPPENDDSSDPSLPVSPTSAGAQHLLIDSTPGVSPSSQDSKTVLRYPYRKDKKSRGHDAIVKQLEDLKFSTNNAVDQLMYELSQERNSASIGAARGEEKSKKSAEATSRVVRFGGESVGLSGRAPLNRTAPGALQSVNSSIMSDQDAVSQSLPASTVAVTAPPVPSISTHIGSRVRRSDALDWDKITGQIRKYLADTKASQSSSTWSAPAPGAPLQPRDGTARPPGQTRLPAGVVQDVLQHGFPDDVARLAQIVSTPVPEQLSTSHRNLMYESFAYLLSSDECRGQYDAIVMPWLMALVQYRLVPTLTRRVQLVLVGALRQVAGQRSEAGVWASRLEAAIAAHGV